MIILNHTSLCVRKLILFIYLSTYLYITAEWKCVFFLFYLHLRETLFDKNVKGPFTLALCDNLAQVLIYPISRLLDIETFLYIFVVGFYLNVSMCNSLSYYYQYVFKTVDKYHKCFIKKTSTPMHPMIFWLCCFFIDFFS